MKNFIHQPVLLKETLEALQVRPGGRYADGTLGGGGHAEAILQASSPNGWLYGCDRDGDALEACRVRLSRYAHRCELRRGNFAGLSQWVPGGSCDGVVLDLGVSSYQLDTPARGFSFQQDGPLDMRMDNSQSLTAAEVVNTAAEEELSRIFWTLGEEPQSRRIARAIVRARVGKPFETTGELSSLIEGTCPRQGARKHPATRVFQALRMYVNQELESLDAGLNSVWQLLRGGGRLAIITFHSLEDRRVKHWAREQARDYTFPGEVDVPELRQPRAPVLRLVTRKAVCAGKAEQEENPRSRSAQLRVMERTALDA